jgi:periplasmic protein TonB
MAVSAGLHGLAFACLWGWFHAGPSRSIVAELDLSLAPLMQAAPNPTGGAKRAAAAWTAPVKGPAPAPAAEAAPETPAETDEAVGPLGDGRGDYIPASQAARKPRWIDRFIEPEDYPRVAREAGKDGRVVLTVLIDATGRVRDARLLKGAYDALNEIALKKVREAVFAPAYDALGRAVACEVTLPIRFELR